MKFFNTMTEKETAAYRLHRAAHAALWGMNSACLKSAQVRKHLADLHDGMVGMGAISPGKRIWVRKAYQNYMKQRRAL
jgi:hypothetical protein